MQRWFLYPPDDIPTFDPDQNVFQWVTNKILEVLCLQLQEIYPNLEYKPIECVLEPNEVIYFPGS